MNGKIWQARPTISVIGTVKADKNGTVVIAGWTLCPCLRECRCHRHPTTNQISVQEGMIGQLGLTKHHVCNCCQPWTVEELQEFVADLAAIAGLPTTEEQLS